MAAGGGSVSARALARSVAHRLKYYIDVQRKENSFDSSGLIRDGMGSASWCTHPMHLIEWEHGQSLEHDFAKIKLEASLRVYVGSAEECHQKVQESPKKQKDLEKFIKEMAQQDYVPDLTNYGRAKRTQRQSYWQRTPSSLHRTATPSMSAEEVRRIVSSASKFVVAATSEVSPKVLGTTQEVVSAPKRRATRTIPSLDRACERPASSTWSPKEEGDSMQECNEEFRPERNQRASEKKGGKKPKTTKKRKNVKCIERPIEMSSSNVSHNFYKPNRVLLSTMLPKSKGSCPGNISFPSPYSPPGKNKVFTKGILKNKTPFSSTSTEKSEYQNIERNSHWKGYLHPLAGHSYRLVEIKKKKPSCIPIGAASRTRSSRSSKPLAGQPTLTSRNAPEVIGNNTDMYSAKHTAEEMHAQSPTAGEKTGETYNSKAVSGWAALNGRGEKMHDQANWKSKYLGKSQRDWPEETQGGLDLASERNPEGHRVHFQMLQQRYHPKNVERKHCSDSRSLGNCGPLESATLPVASVDESCEILACLQDQDKDHIVRVAQGPSLVYQVCQGEDQNVPASFTMNESMNTDGNVGNQEIEGHSGKLLNQILSLHEGDAKAIDDPTSQMEMNDLILGDLRDQQVVYIPPVLPGVGETSEEEDGSSASPGMSTSVPGRLENEASEEEFTISSASSSLSEKSFASRESRNTNAELKEGEENASSGAEIRVPDMMEESAVQRGMSDEHSERLSSSPEEKRTKKDRGPECTSAARVVYFSYLPMSL